MPTTRLHRSNRDKVLFGVAGGLAEYFNVDSVLVRLAFVVTVFAGGAGLLAYIVLAIIMPKEEASAAEPVEVMRENLEDIGNQAAEAGRRLGEAVRGAPSTGQAGGPVASGDGRHRTFGLILIGVGIVLLLANLGVFWWFNWANFWPLILIALGIALLAGRFRRD